MNKLMRNSGSRWAAVGLAGLLGASALAFEHASKDKVEHPTVNVPIDESPVARDGMTRGSFAPIVKTVAPVVVKIMTTMTMKSPAQGDFPGLDDPFWRRFFGDQSGQMRPRQQPGRHVERGIGSGVIVTKDGYILTNNHVVDGASEVKVTLQDGHEYIAKVIGRDAKSDIAVVKIDAGDLPFVRMADSEKVQVGDVVLAVGNPFGVGQTVTQGIVSATDRGNMGIEDYEDFIQTDAAINPGNSGGALIDIDGRLIGINTAILSRSGGSQGVGFAIPSNLARTVMESLVKNGHVTRGYLGVSIQTITPALAEEFSLKSSKGALVGDTTADSPAAKAGLKSGDVIVKFNGKDVDDSRRLQLQVAETAPGAKVPVEIIRDGSSKTIDVTVKSQPGTEKLAENVSTDKTDTGTLNGVGVTDLDRDARGQFNIPKEVTGAVVTQVDPDSAAAEAGLKPGAVIQEINHQAVKGAEDAIRLTEHPKTKRTLVRVWENGGSHYVVVDETKNEG